MMPYACVFACLLRPGRQPSVRGLHGGTAWMLLSVSCHQTKMLDTSTTEVLLVILTRDSFLLGRMGRTTLFQCQECGIAKKQEDFEECDSCEGDRSLCSDCLASDYDSCEVCRLTGCKLCMTECAYCSAVYCGACEGEAMHSKCRDML